MTATKDQAVISHYRRQMELANMDEDFMPTYHSTPRIAGAFNGWHYTNMREIVPFCEKNDPDPPDFLEMCVSDGSLRLDENCKPEAATLKTVEARKSKYYAENWSLIIMRILRYKNPLVANAHLLTSMTNKIDPGTKVYFHIDWVKPGRHTFLIQHDNQEVKLEKESAGGGILGLMGIKRKVEPAPMLPQLKKSKADFYVHEMLATFRTDQIPPCK